MNFRFLLIGLLAFVISNMAYSQDDLLALLEDETPEESYEVRATFKGTRLINGHSIETRKKNTLIFLISHRFGEINSGSYQFFGLDQSNIRIALEYAISDRFNTGFGRNSFEKTFDGYLKYKLIGQTTSSVPVSVSLLSSATIKTLKDNIFVEDVSTSDRMAFVHQVLVARKFSSGFSFQLMPSYVHFNAITLEQKRNDLFALGAGGRIKLTQRLSLNAEYYFQINTLSRDTYNSIAIGVDIETGGHVFQLHLTNSQSMIEKGFIAETTNDFFGGNIHFGFNISRAFQLGN